VFETFLGASMALLLVLASWLFVGLFVCFVFALKWNEIRYGRKGLPPGTMGWPLFGETAEFLKHGPDFMKKQRARCDFPGPKFLVGILDREFNHQVVFLLMIHTQKFHCN